MYVNMTIIHNTSGNVTLVIVPSSLKFRLVLWMIAIFMSHVLLLLKLVFYYSTTTSNIYEWCAAGTTTTTTTTTTTSILSLVSTSMISTRLCLSTPDTLLVMCHITAYLYQVFKCEMTNLFFCVRTHYWLFVLGYLCL